MKKILPKSITNSSGFTLLELMVVMTIIAILAVVGISLYSGAQANARDGIRRTEINSLGKSIESAKDPTTSGYKYTSTNYASDYPQNKPADPSKDATKPLYCIATNGTTMPNDPSAAGWTSACPSSYVTAVNESSVWPTASGPLDSAVKYWKLCAKLETGNVFCVRSSSQ